MFSSKGGISGKCTGVITEHSSLELIFPSLEDAIVSSNFGHLLDLSPPSVAAEGLQLAAMVEILVAIDDEQVELLSEIVEEQQEEEEEVR